MENRNQSKRVRRSLLNLLHLMKLRQALILAVIIAMISGGIVSSLVVVWQVGNTIIINAHTRVDQNMNTAWAIYNNELEKMSIVIQNLSYYPIIKNTLEDERLMEDNSPNELEAAMQSVMNEYSLDFLTLTNKNGIVLGRAAPPYNRNDIRSSSPLVARALRGEVVYSTEIVTSRDLAIEAAGLDQRAFIGVEDSGEAKTRLDNEQSSGMALMAAVPVEDSHGRILGVIYAGKLLNRNYDLVDKIKNIIYKGGKYKGKDMATTNVFQNDVCISTNVLKKNGHRAIGTQVSPDIHGQVLEKGASWGGRSYNVNAWYIARCSPVRNSNNEIIGMLYIGILEQKFIDTRNHVILTFVLIIVVGSVIGIYISKKISKTVDVPIGKLVDAANELEKGNLSHRVHIRSFKELELLAESFNAMTEKLENSIKDKDSANKEISKLNKHYIEMLGFVSHELMHPLGILKGYLIMLQDGSLGEINSKQKRILSIMLRNVNGTVAMARKYLHLSKIEKGEIMITKKYFDLFDEIVFPLVQIEKPIIEISQMQLEIEKGDQMRTAIMYADPTLIKIVFNNLLQNALKYGRKGGKIVLKFEETSDHFMTSVWNTGDGIPADKLETIFEKFERLEKDVRSGIKGTGLGLYNTRQIIEKHGGKMWAKSQEGEYAEFIFTLPKGNGDPVETDGADKGA